MNNLPKKLQKEALNRAALQMQYEAYDKLYEAACMANDSNGMEIARQKLHDLLDMKLDNSGVILRLCQELGVQGSE